jgi:hypothetical protein
MRGFQSSFSAVQATTPTCGGATRTCAAFSLGTATCCACDRFENTVSNVLRVLHYLRGTISRRLFFPRSSSLQLQAYVMLPGLVIPLTVALFLPIVFFLSGSLIA